MKGWFLVDDPNQSAEDSESDDTSGVKPKSSGGGDEMMGEAHEPEPDETTNSQDNDQ